MKILVVSDTHGRRHNLRKTLERVSPIDLLIHLGDFEGRENDIEMIAPCPVEFVAGNNDFFTGLPKEKLIQIGKYKVLLTHGHKYGVNYGTGGIEQAALKCGADIVMFGHTHIPFIDLSHDIWTINPGSLTLPRQDGRVPTFIIMEIDSKGDAHFSLNYYREQEEHYE